MVSMADGGNGGYGLGYQSPPGGSGGIFQGNNQGGSPHNGNPQGYNLGGYPHNGNHQGYNQGGSPHSDSPQGINLSGIPHNGYPQGDIPGGVPHNGNSHVGNHGGIHYPQWSGHSNGKGGKGDIGGFDTNGNAVPVHMKGPPVNGSSGNGAPDWAFGSPQFVDGKGGNGGFPLQHPHIDGKGGSHVQQPPPFGKGGFPTQQPLDPSGKNWAFGPNAPTGDKSSGGGNQFPPHHPDLPQTSGGYPMQQPNSFGKGGSPMQQPQPSGGKGGYPIQQPQTSGGKGGYSNIQYYPSQNGKGGNYNKGYNGSSMQFKWCASCGSQNQINHK